MYICIKLSNINMFGRLSEVLQSAADVLAPPPSPLQDFEYHWKIIKQFYSIDRSLPKVHLNDTNIPYHLDQMLQILIKEELTELEKIKRMPNSTRLNYGECMGFLLNNNLLDILIELGISDTPPGARLNVLHWIRRFLSCLQYPPIDHINIFQSIHKLVKICNGKVPSPYESEEILFLLSVAGLVRKNSNLIHLFLPYHQHSAFVAKYIVKPGNRFSKTPNKNPLFDCDKIESNIRRISILHEDEENGEQKNKEEGDRNTIKEVVVTAIPINGDGDGDTENDCDNFNYVCDCDEGERLYLLDALISYFESPDSIVIVRACEGALILGSISTVTPLNCTAVQTSYKVLANLVLEKIIHLSQQIPEDMDLGDIDEANVSWGLIPRDSEQEHFIGRYQLFNFLCWLDYLDCLARECTGLHVYLAENLRKTFFEDIIEPAMLDINAPFMTVLAAKIIRQFHSKFLQEEIANWLVGDKTVSEINGSDSFLTIIIENAQDNNDLIFQTLQFIEALLDNPNERILHGMIYFYINNRGYFDTLAPRVQSWSDEEDERDKRRGSADGPIKSRTLAPSNILKIINNFLLLLPRQIVGEGVGTCYEEYVQDASRHYQIWIKKTENFSWPVEAVFSDVNDRSRSASLSPSTSLGLTKPNTSSIDASQKPKKGSQCNDSGISEETFYEGPLLRMLFNHVKNMASQQYELNLAVIAILSKLALFPHPYLHEILLSPEIPVAHGSTTLWSAMQVLAKKLLLEIPRIENFQQKILETGKRLLTNPPILSENDEDNDPLFESIIVLEEFCKELAAIAFVKYHHATE